MQFNHTVDLGESGAPQSQSHSNRNRVGRRRRRRLTQCGNLRRGKGKGIGRQEGSESMTVTTPTNARHQPQVMTYDKAGAAFKEGTWLGLISISTIYKVKLT